MKFQWLTCILYQKYRICLLPKQVAKSFQIHAYLQVPLAEESQNYFVINTHKGLYAYMRLPFGVASTLEIFQCIMNNVL